MLYYNQKEGNDPTVKEITTMKTAMKIIAGVYLTACVLFGAWAFASWCDIVADNTQPNPVHSEYNLFVMMTENNK